MKVFFASISILLFTATLVWGSDSPGDEENYSADDYLGIEDTSEYAQDLENLGYTNDEINEAISIMVEDSIDFAFGSGPDDLIDINWSNYITQLRVRFHSKKSGSCTPIRNITQYVESCRVISTHLVRRVRHYKIEVRWLPCFKIPSCISKYYPAYEPTGGNE